MKIVCPLAVPGRQLLSLACCLFVFCGQRAVIASPAASSDATSLSGQVISAFQARCAACHGPAARKPKKFGYVLDLSRLAASKYVVPGQPDKSKLWESVASGDMPPEDSKTGPMSPEQKSIVRNWILAGAPAGAAGEPVALGANPEPTTGPASRLATPGLDVSRWGSPGESAGATLPFGKRLLRLIGKFHPLVAHFPIALMVGAGVAELAWLHSKKPWLTGAIRFCLVFGAVAAIFTAALGWADAYFHTRSDELTVHRWVGTIAALWAIPTFFLSERGFRHRAAAPPGLDEPRPWFTFMLFLGVILIGIAAHFGGNLVYGPDYLNW